MTQQAPSASATHDGRLWGLHPDGGYIPIELDAAGNLPVTVNASPGGGGPATIADGADVAEGATTDTKVTGDTTGTTAAKLRGLSTIWASVWDSLNNWLKVSIQNTSLAVAAIAATVGSTSNVAANLASVTILASNSSRRGLVVFNDSATGTLYLKFGTTASTSDFTYRLGPLTTLELGPVYSGRVDGLWDIATGNARVTELT